MGHFLVVYEVDMWLPEESIGGGVLRSKGEMLEITGYAEDS